MDIKKEDIAYTIAFMLLEELPEAECNMKTIDEILLKAKDVLNEVPLNKSILQIQNPQDEEIRIDMDGTITKLGRCI